MFFVGVAMCGISLYTPLLVQGALGKTATGSGTLLTPLVLAMTAVGGLRGQIIARLKSVKPFTLFGTTAMAFGVYLLTISTLAPLRLPSRCFSRSRGWGSA
jgi:hypothetical protein